MRWRRRISRQESLIVVWLCEMVIGRLAAWEASARSNVVFDVGVAELGCSSVKQIHGGL